MLIPHALVMPQDNVNLTAAAVTATVVADGAVVRSEIVSSKWMAKKKGQPWVRKTGRVAVPMWGCLHFISDVIRRINEVRLTRMYTYMYVLRISSDDWRWLLS